MTYKLYTEPSCTRDTIHMLQADQAFLERISERLTRRELVSGNRVWLGREEIRNLRRLAGMGTGAKTLGKNRRVRLATVRQFLAHAEDKLGVRAAALVSAKLVPKRSSDDMLDVRQWSQTMINQQLGRGIAAMKFARSPDLE